MKFYEIPKTKCSLSWCTRWARRPHAEKLLSTTLHIPYLAEIWKILCLDPSLLCASFNYCCSSKHNNKALRITFNSCKTVSTSTMVLATVTIDKIIKVTSASSYVLWAEQRGLLDLRLELTLPLLYTTAYLPLKMNACTQLLDNEKVIDAFAGSHKNRRTALF